MIATASKPIRKRRQTRARRCTFKNAYTRFFTRVQYGPNLYAGYYAMRLALDPSGLEIRVYDEVGGPFYTRHRWIEIVRGNEFFSFGLHPGPEGPFKGKHGNLTIPENHSGARQKQLLERYNSTAAQEASLMFSVLVQRKSPIPYLFHKGIHCRFFVRMMLDFLVRDFGDIEKLPITPAPPIVRFDGSNNIEQKMVDKMKAFILQHLPGTIYFDSASGRRIKVNRDNLKKALDLL